MNKELAAIAEAMDKSTGDGRDHSKAVQLSEAYVKAHPDLFTGLDKFDVPLLVQLVSKKRAAGDEEGRWNIEAYLLATFEPQQIGGEYKATVRLPNK